ncbi:hypothetical protein D3C78_891210 [compost metagenome]
MIRHVRRNEGGDFYAFFMGPMGQHLNDALDHPPQVFRARIEPEATRFHRRIIQQILDQLHQRLAGLLHAIEIIALLLIELRLRQKMVHAEHAGKRQADFVAYGGKQPCFFGIGLFGPQPGIFPLTERKPLFGHISGDTADEKPAACQIAGHDIMPGKDALTERGRDLDIIGVDLVTRAESDADFLAAQPFGGRTAGHFTKDPVRLNDAPVHVADHDDIAHEFLHFGNQRAVLRLPHPEIGICNQCVGMPGGFAEERVEEDTDKHCAKEGCQRDGNRIGHRKRDQGCGKSPN